MRTNKYFIILLALASLSAHAQDFAQRMAQTYLENDKHFEITCLYTNNKSFKLITESSETIKTKDQLSRQFVIETEDQKVPMNFTLSRLNRNFEYKIVFDQKYESKGKLSERDFYIAPVADAKFAALFETSNIYCSVNLAMAKPFILKDGDYHISVHPHTIYDWQSLLKVPVESYLRNEDYQSLILLEGSNDRGGSVNLNDFFDGLPPKLSAPDYESELELVPTDVPLVVSPTGNSDYEIEAKTEINVVFTGGNHNYCMWNGTRHLIEGLMTSKSEAVLNITYDTAAIVAQVKGMDGLKLNFSRKDVSHSNLLRDLLSKKEIQQTYHASYLSYFKGYLANEYSAQYKTYTIHYKAQGFETTVTLQGKGERDLVVNFNYL